ncbi:MAG: CPBP family intramembrane metalloprotease [Deltaproteobacteria bacterium]|nr:CPBP family intramembrane metalloprotease [Deltaproteobacteria bacterium]
MSRAVPLVVGAYAVVGAVGVGIGALRGAPNVFVMTRDAGALSLGEAAIEGGGGHLASVAGGLALALAVIAATRFLVRTQSWAAALHADLRPVARALGPSAILPVALASSLGEEMLFRGALVPWIGVIASSLLFGALHQLRGRSRLSWAGFAMVVGLLFGALFRATGSLLGPIVAHALINAANLRFLLDHAPEGEGGAGNLLRR